jgi:broad specificity phosphatase PhoE
MGKTSLASLVAIEARRRGWTVVQLSAEGRRDLDALASSLAVEFERHHGALRRAARAVGERTTLNFGAATITPGTYEPRFEEVVEAAEAAADGRLLLILDELPLFARDLNAHTPTTQEGTAALHVLRRLRQTHTGLRMLCLGSVGFHHVVRDGSAVLNDTERVQLQPLASTGTDPDAQYLARCLLHGARGVDLVDPRDVANTIAEEVDGVPFYIHKVVAAAEARGGKIDGDAVRSIVASALSTGDAWHLRHYRERVVPYYGNQAVLAQAALDAIARAGSPLDLPSICRRIATDPDVAPVDPERVRDVLERLEDDHYLVREGSQRRFAFELVRRAWIELRR